MLGERCTRLILSLDGVLSYGDSTIKQRRKDLIVRVQRFQQYVDVLVERSKSPQNWFTECSLSPIQRLEYDIITQSEQEPRKKCTILYDCFLYQTTDDYFHSLRTEVLASPSLFVTLATAISKSSCVTCIRFSRIANMPASVHTAYNKGLYKPLTLHSAPLASVREAAILRRSIPRIRFIFLLWI